MELSEQREELLSRTQAAMAKAVEHSSQFSSYSYLWVDDRQHCLAQFLVYGHMPTLDEIEAAGIYTLTRDACRGSPWDYDTLLISAGEEGLPKTPPSLDKFKVQIDSYQSVYRKVEGFASSHVCDGWLRVDCMPFRAALLNTVRRWSLMFNEHLVNHVTNRWAVGGLSMSWYKVIYDVGMAWDEANRMYMF